MIFSPYDLAPQIGRNTGQFILTEAGNNLTDEAGNQFIT